MADKKITDLQPAAAVTADFNVPGDDSLQTYRFTVTQLKNWMLANENVVLAMLKNDIFSGLSSVTPADDDYFVLSDVSDSNKTKKGLVGSFLNSKYRSVTSTDAVTASDETMKLSGASFTSTLPTAIGVTGKRYKYVHAGNAFTEVYTIVTTAGQTVGGIASGAFKLFTTGEVLVVESDGANWIIVGRHTKYYARQTGIGITGVSANPTKPTTRVYDYVDVWREGKYAKFDFRWYVAVTTGGTTGTGFYKIALPFSLQMDTAIQPNSGGTFTDTTLNNSFSIPMASARFRTDSGPTAGWLVYAPCISATEFGLYLWRQTGAGSYWGSTGFALNEIVSGVFSVTLPINEWQP